MIPIEFILLALSPIFLACIAWEFVRCRSLYNIRDSLANAALALMHQASDMLALTLLMPLFFWLFQWRWFDIPLTLSSFILAALLQDFLYYWFHRASHHVHWLWAAHVVHHSSKQMNFSTAFRQSFLYPLAGMWLFWLPLIVLGFHPSVVFAIVAINLAYQFFVHTQVVPKLGWIEYWLNTPSHHRVHHALNHHYRDRNFGGVLIIWDRLFGTFVAEREHEPLRYGIVGNFHSHNPWRISIHQWCQLWRELRSAPHAYARLRVLFGYPPETKA